MSVLNVLLLFFLLFHFFFLFGEVWGIIWDKVSPGNNYMQAGRKKAQKYIVVQVHEGLIFV